MRSLTVIAIMTLLCTAPASAGVVDGHVYGDFYQKGYGIVTFGGGATSIEDALAAVDGKYVKISAEYYSGTSYWYSLIVKFPTPALNLYIRVHFASGVSKCFTIQQHGAYIGDYRARLDYGFTLTGPYAADLQMYWPDQINYVEVCQVQQYGPGEVYIDAIEALNIPPVVNAGPDVTIAEDAQATTVLQGKITDIGAYSTGYVWQKDGVSLSGWLPFVSDGAEQSVPLDLSTLAPLAPGTYTFTLFTKDGGINVADEMILTVSSNQAPVAGAGDDVTIQSADQALTVIQGTASDGDNDALTYRWLEGTNVLLDTTPVVDGAAPLDLSTLPTFTLGAHALTLEVNDGTTTNSASVVLTLLNTPPSVSVNPVSQSVEIGLDAIMITGTVADFDADSLTYEWSKDGQVLESGPVNPGTEGPYELLDLAIAAGDERFPLGTHTVTLQVSDGTNTTMTTATVTVQDSQMPTLSPTSSANMLWPPNHQLVPVTICANAADNGGGAIVLGVAVECSEDDGGTDPDWYVDSIDNAAGTIALRLRAERFGKGEGRVYTITVTATDASSNQSSAIVEVCVPHDKRKK